MKRLTETWKQQKQRNQQIKTLPSQNAGHGSGKKRLGQHAISRNSSDASASNEPTRNNAHCGSSDLVNSTTLPKRTSPRLRANDANGLSSPSSRRLSTESSRTSNISFASDFEIDDDILKHVEQLEADFEQQNVHTKSPNNLDKDNYSAINLEENEENGNNPRNQDSGKNIEYKDNNKHCNDIIQVLGQNKKCTNSAEDQRESAIRFDRTKAFSFVQSFASGKNEFDKEENATGEVLCQDSQSPESKESHPNHDGSNVKLNCQHDNLDGLKKQPLGFDTSPLSLNGQRSPISPPPTSTQECLSLSSWGLPEAVLNQYYLMGVQNMFPWQVQCLRKGKVLQGGNLIYSAPTSAGKTLVAELLVLKKVLESKKKAIIILPFVSVSREKMFYLQTLLQDTNVRVDGFMGSHSPPGGLKSVDVAVCTIEKANSLINRLLEEKKLDQLGIIVVDELHMVGDSHRGYLLELLLTKVKYVTSAETNRTSIQIVGMSATLPNLDLLAKWLDADLYSTDFRPVPLTEFVKIGPSLYDSQMSHAKNFDLKYDVQNDEDHIFSLCLETVAMGCGVLIFCPTKNWCEKLAENMARELSRLRGVIPIKSSGFVKASEFLTLKINHEALQDVLEQLKGTPAGLDSTLKKTVPCAVAYHHAGLTFDERDIVEGGFRQGHIRILIATSTLSSGVNLPARRVIIRTIMFNRRVIDPLCYRQMAGRAGRKGVDTEGESILVCKPNEMEKAKALISSDLPPVQSCLIQREGDELSNSMKRAILEVIASGVAKSPTDVQRYSSSTLLAASLPSEDGDNPDGKATSSSSSIDACISFLREQEFIRLEKGEDGGETFLPTQLGSATLASALSPHEALAVFTELQRARKSFVLENELHILYQVTPIYDNIKPDWYQFLCFWETLSTDKRRVAELVGVEERFLIRAAKGNIPTHTARQQHLLSVHRRFHTALILEELVNEAPLNQVARKYGCSKGQLQSLQQSASTFAGMVTVFCSKLGWYNLELLLAQFQNRLNFGVQRELVDLVRISLLNAQRARLLYNGGLTDPASVATASPREVERILRNAVPFKSGRQAVDEKDFEAAERRAARCIWASGKKGLTEAEAAELIVMEAKHIVRAELGSMGIEWIPRDVNKRTVELDRESGHQTGDLNKDGKGRMEGEDGAKTGKKDGEDGEGSNNEMEMETNQSKPQGVRHRVVNLGKECKEQMGSTSKKGVVVKDINDQSQRSKIGKDQQATRERMDLEKTSSGSNFPRKNSGLKVKGLSVVPQQSVLVECERNKPVQSETKFVPYSKGGVKDGAAVKQISVEEKTCEKVDKEGGRVALSRDVNKAEVRNQFNKKKSGSAEMKNRNGKTQLTDKVERKMTVDEDRNKDDDDREDGRRDGYVGNTRELRVRRPTRNNSNIQKEEQKSSDDTRVQGLPLTTSGGNCGTTEHKGIVKVERYSNQFSRVNKVGQKTTVKGDSRDEMKTDEVGEMVSEVGFSQKRTQDEKPAVRPSESHSSGDSPELFLGSPEESQSREEAEEDEDVCGMDAAAKEEESKVKNGSCPKEYSFLFSPIDSNLEDFLENYDSQQDIIAISASPELKAEKKSVERHVRTSSGLEKTNKDLSKPAIEFNGGREPQTKDAFIDHSLGQSKDRRKDLDQAPENKVGKILNLGEASSKCSSHFTKHKRDNFNSASQPKDIITEDLIPDGRENVEKCSISEPVLSDNFLDETSECLSPGTLAVLDFLVDGDGEDVTFTQVNSPTNSKSPDLFSEDPDLQLKDPVLEGSVRRQGDDLGKSKLERSFYGKVDIEEKKHSKDRRLQWKCGNSVKVPQRGSPSTTAMQRDVDTCKADTPNRNLRKRKSNEKLPGKESGAVKRVSRCHSVNRSKVNSTSGTPSAPSDSLPRTPSKGKTPLPFLNSGVMRSSSRRPCRRSKISSAASSSSSKGKAMLSFNFETPTDVDIETVSSECDDLDVAMDSEDLDIEFEPSQPEEPSHLADLATKSASGQEQSDKKVNSQMDEIDIDSDISLSEVEGNVHFQDDRQSRRRRDCQKFTEATSTKRNKQVNNHEIIHLADNLQAGEISETCREKTSSAVRNEIDLNQTADQPQSQLSILESPIAPSTPETFAIIDVCANKDLFETFICEWKRKKRYAFSIGCELYEVPVEGGGIGGNHRRGKTLGQEVDGLPLGRNKLLVTGLAISWGAKDAYYISFQEKNVKVDLDASLSAPPNDESISVYKRIQEVTSTLELSTISKGSQRSTIHRVAFDIKEQLKILVQVFGCVFSGIIEDPKVAHWLLDPSAKEKNLHGMISQYLPTQAGILDNIGGGIGLSSLGISPQNPGSARLRACVESVLLLDLMESLKKGLSDNHLLDAFRKIEMPSIMTLTHVELNGFGFNPDECETQKVFMQSKLSALEEQAYLLAGRSFSLTSPEDIAQVLFMELKLPPNGDVIGCNQGRVTMPPRKTLGGRGRGRLPKQFSTSKESLEKIRHLHPLPGLISEWRKMSMSLTKVVFPLQKEKVFNEKLGMYRMFTVYQTHSATGRVTTLEPNIQAIPKDFEISLPSVIGESPPHWSGPILSGPATATKGKAKRESRRSSVQCKMTMKEPEGLKTAVSLRHAFCPFPGGLLLAADYSQLELRILAHLSQDVKLIRILNADGDVFRQIAAQWKNVEERDVTDKQRQEAKQICYGMIYGIGAKALGEQLEIEEEDAACFMETFRDQYKGMKNFIKQTVAKCRERGFVETISKRRRYLPSINHSNLGARNHAERQAVNTTIQGSAADLVKTAMVQLQQQLSSSFPSTRISHRHRDKGKIGLPKCRTRHAQNTQGSVRGAYLVLQLHDELIYEVHKDDLEKVVTLVRKLMESAMRLLVKLPVKIKVGPTWGSLKEI